MEFVITARQASSLPIVLQDFPEGSVEFTLLNNSKALSVETIGWAALIFPSGEIEWILRG